jgi:hypothetical protein
VAAEEAISEREMAAARIGEAQQMENDRELGELRARNEAASFDREAAERVRRSEREQEDARTLAALQTETTLHALSLERQRNAEETEVGRLRIDQEYALRRLRVDAELALARSEAEATHDRELLELERDRIRAGIDNEQSPASIQAALVRSLPDIVDKLPKPAELRSVTIGGNDATTVTGLLAELTAVVGALRSATSKWTVDGA